MGLDAPAAEARRERLPANLRTLVGAGFLVAIGYGIVTPVLPAYALGFGVGIGAASAVVSAFAVFRLAFAPASGVLVRRLGEPPVFCAGLVVVGLSSAACAWASDFGELLAYRAVGGIGSTMFTVSAAALLVRMSPPTMRGRAAGAWATWFLAGSIGGPLIGGALVALGPRAPFLVYAVLLITVAACTARTLRCPAAPRAPQLTITTRDTDWTALMRNPTFRAAMATNFAYGWTVYGVRIAVVPLFVGEQLGWETGWTAIALSAFAVGTAATSSLSGGLADRHGRRPIAVLGLVLVAIAMCGMGFSGSPVTIIIVAVLSGAGTGLTTPAANAAVADVLTKRDDGSGPGGSLAAYQMVGDVGAIVGPVAAGMVADRSGYRMAFALTAAVAALALACWYRAAETVADRDREGGTPPFRGPVSTA